MAAQPPSQPPDESLLDKGVSAAKPWRKGTAWWLVLLEGIILFAAGLYGLIAPSHTTTAIRWVFALALAVLGIIELVAALRMREAGGARRATLLQGVVGLVLGVLILFAGGALSGDTGRIILGLGAVAFGLLGVWRYVAQRASHPPRNEILLSLFFLVIGVLVFLAGIGVGDVVTYVRIVSILLVVCAVVLIVWAIQIRRRGPQTMSTTAPPPGTGS